MHWQILFDIITGCMHHPDDEIFPGRLSISTWINSKLNHLNIVKSLKNRTFMFQYTCKFKINLGHTDSREYNLFMFFIIVTGIKLLIGEKNIDLFLRLYSFIHDPTVYIRSNCLFFSMP